MTALDSLRHDGWSYWAGYSHDYRSCVARAWKPRPKPQRMRSPGGSDVTLVNFCCSSLGDSLEDAATKCAEIARTDPDRAWWQGLPVTSVAEDEWRKRQR